eukprot:TRINITY_DN3905_c0_g1_i1.p1 TRINITY_DN3905_c0_g1~~TRINITY_DN3905_c0_g1_i1.p1  ORF type:complete len:420 (-),score=162.33 TRINITY_DN3905_c0_g1_i1:29-1288(-)
MTQSPSLLLQAFNEGEYDILAWLLEHKEFNGMDDILRRAISEDDSMTAQILLAHGADASLTYGGLPLTELCDRDSDCYNLLVEAGALQETKRMAHKQFAKLAVDPEQRSYLQHLLVNHIVSPHETDKRGNNLVFHLINHCAHFFLSTVFNDSLVVLNHKGDTPLSYAIKTGCEECISIIAEAQTDFSIENEKGMPVVEQVGEFDANVARNMVHNGASFSHSGDNAIEDEHLFGQVLEAGESELALRMIKSGIADVVEKANTEYLSLAVENCNEKVCLTLLAHGFHPDTKDDAVREFLDVVASSDYEFEPEGEDDQVESRKRPYGEDDEIMLDVGDVVYFNRDDKRKKSQEEEEEDEEEENFHSDPEEFHFFGPDRVLYDEDDEEDEGEEDYEEEEEEEEEYEEAPRSGSPFANAEDYGY